MAVWEQDVTTSVPPAGQEWARPRPVPSPLTAPFWEATARGELIIQRCRTCEQYVWTPQHAGLGRCQDRRRLHDKAGAGSVQSNRVLTRSRGDERRTRRRWHDAR